MRISIEPVWQSAVRLGAVVFEGLANRDADPRLDQPLALAATTARAGGRDADSGAVRAMYRRFGIDPTKTRPSSEALLRRVRKGDPLPRVNSLVDISNWCSLEFQLPYGLYDLEHVRGDIILREGRAGEEYPGIRKQAVHVAGRPTLVDDDGPFGNPTSDSARTMVTTETHRALVILYAPRALSERVLADHLETTASRVLAIVGGSEVSRAIVR
jgi:DNA/RNA-binding domain of Phe-tRNA-synthetase-like protein